MRIAHVTCLYPPAHLGGAPQQCEAIALSQLARGHQVSVFSGLLDPGGPMYAARRMVQDGVEVSFLNTIDAFSERAERNWRHREVEPFFAAFLEAHRPQVVHFHSIQSLGGSLLPLAARAGASVVVTMHDLWWVCARQFCVDRTWQTCIPAVTSGSCACERGSEELERRNTYLRDCLGSCELVLAPSQALIDRIRWSGLVGRMEVDPNGVAPAPAQAPRSPHEGPLRIVFAGGSNHMKGLQVLIPALRALTDRGLDYSASIYGVDPFAIRTTSALRGLPARSLKSFRPEQLDGILAESDVLVLPSVMFESSSRMVREALLRGVPAVATETGGPEEVIEHGVNGLLVPPGDSAALAEALARLITEPELRARLSGAGPRGEVPSPAGQVRHLEHLYESPGGDRGGRSAPRGELVNVLFLAGIEGAPLRYRVHQAIEQLGLRGIGSVLRHYADPRAVKDLDGAQAVIIYRSPATRELLAFVREAKRRGLPVIFDLDDLIFDPELAEQLPSLAGLSREARRLWVDGVRRYRATLEECGRGLGSTPEIVRRMAEIGIDARLHPNGTGTALAVASEAARRARPPSPDGAFRVGYFSGTDTHDVDLDHIASVLAGFQRDHPVVELVLGGHLLPHRLLERASRLPFAPWHQHPMRLAALDLNLAPLIEGPFNDAKSSIKWSEAALVEVPTLASASEPFRASIRQRETGLLASDPAEWAEQLEYAISDPDRLRRIGRRARLAAYGEGTPWLLGGRLVASLEHFLGAAIPAGTDPPDGRWPSESQLTALEPAGLYPGLAPSGARGIPGDSLAGRPVLIQIPSGMGPLKRLDVQVATYGRPAQDSLRLRLSGGSDVGAEAVAPAAEIGDNGWVAFELEPSWPVDAGACVKLSSDGGSDIAPWITAGGAIAVRSFHIPPVPPEFPLLVPTPAPVRVQVGLGERLRVLSGFGALVGRQAVYIVRSEGPLRGSRRLAGAVRRRVLERLILRFRGTDSGRR